MHQCESRKRNPGVALSSTHDSYDVNEEDGSSCDPRSPTAPSSPRSRSPSSPRSPAKKAILTTEVRTWSRGEDRAQQHSIPIQFNPVSIHLSKWIDSMRIRSGSVYSRLQCGRDQCALMRIECAFSAQCGQAFRGFENLRRSEGFQTEMERGVVTNLLRA